MRAELPNRDKFPIQSSYLTECILNEVADATVPLRDTPAAPHRDKFPKQSRLLTQCM